MSRSAAPQAERSADLKTLPDIGRVFSAAPSARLACGATLIAAASRLVVGRFALADVAVLATVFVLVGPVEWTIHRFLLHAGPDTLRTRWGQSSVAHGLHHDDPTLLAEVLLGTIYAAAFIPAIAAFAALWSLPLAAALGADLAPVYLTALTASWFGLAHYEWVHLLSHATYRPKTRYYRRLSRNHRRHHFKDETRWLGVTSNLGDRLFRTLG